MAQMQARPSATGKVNPLQRAWQRLTASDSELVHLEMADQAQKSGAENVCDCRVRSRVVLQGIISTVRLNPQSNRPWLEVSLDDGTGEAQLVWMGRRSIPGIQPGRRVRVEGRLANHHGRKVIFNPRYELLG